MNILFVGMYPDEYSPYRNVFFQNLIFSMADEGIDCTVISPIPITRYRQNIRKVSFHRVDFTLKGVKVNVYHPRYISLSNKHIGKFNTGIWSERLFQNSAIKMARKLQKEFDVIYGHFFLSGGLAAIKIGREMNKPSFIANGECEYKSEVIDLYREITPEELDGLSGIIAVSTNNAKVLASKSLFNGYPIIVAPNAIDASLFKHMDKHECRKKLKLPQDKFIVGFVGGFIERKGDKRLLKAINSINGVYGAFAGNGNDKPVGSKVLFCDSLQHEDIPVFLNAMDVFCLPTKNEGSCNAIIEAAACGIPIISSDLPFNDDLLSLENSIRINPESEHEIASAIYKLYKNEELRKKLALKIQEDANKFTIDRRCRKILNFIQENI